METGTNKYLNRPIGEDEEELLDEIWNSLPAVNSEDNMLNQNYKDVKRKIQRRKTSRRVYLVSGCAAVVSLFVVLLFRQAPLQELPVYAQLNDMGVSVSNQQVQLMIGDSTVMNLENSARINVDKHSKVALQSSNGKKIMLDREKTLRIHVPAGKRFDLELADGTHVWLNSSTWFEYPTSFNAHDERRVKINGEGFFEVTRDTTKPFYIEIPNGESIRVLGTSFNVSAYADGDENVTTLLTGKIQYHIPAANQAITLLPNQQISVNKTTNYISTNEVNASEYSMWKEGVLYFNDERLPEIAKKLSRTYGIEIKVAEEYNDSRFSGMIRHERGIDYITKLLTTTSNIKCIVKNGVILLK